jgi:WD40 repeat protein
MAVTRSSQYLITGDSYGVIKTWPLTALVDFWTQHSLRESPPMDTMHALATWRGHNSGVSSIATVEADEPFFLTSSFDCDVALWTAQGGHVGTFGKVRPSATQAAADFFHELCSEHASTL